MRIERLNTIFNMDKENVAVMKAKSGDQVTFETCDCFSDVIKTEKDVVSGIDFDRINPATGPLYVEGAEVGDVLKVQIMEIRLDKQGVTVAAPGLGRIADRVTNEETIVCPVENDFFKFLDLELPLTKMIGVIGTAPKDEPVSTGTPYDHGGNMDCTMITEGSILYLPVNVEGALLSMGDLHASMGDGEIMGSGLEIAGEVKVKVEVLKEFKYSLPMIETNDLYITLGSKKTMEEASDLAISNMIEIVKDKKGYSDNQAGMFLSLVGDLKVCQIVDPNMTMRVEVKKEYLL